MKQLSLISVFALLFIALISTQCNQQGQGFALPEGSIEQGKLAYQKFDCSECHAIEDIQYSGNNPDLMIKLGGEVHKLKTYGDLVTSVINPSHRVSDKYKKTVEQGISMESYNDIMTVQELVDMVTYLQSKYDIASPPTNYYPYY